MNTISGLKVFACFLILSVLSVAARRTVESINDGWSFRYIDDTEWTSVAVPHTYNDDAYRTMNYYKGKAQYHLKLPMPEIDKSRRYFIKFDAVNKAADLSVNGIPVADHAGGYSAFCHDISQYIKEGDNDIYVTVDNSRIDIPPLSADFTFMGGIYRDVWLISTPLKHFDMCDNASSGVYVTPTNVSEHSASLKIKSRIKNDDATAAGMKLVLTLNDKSGRKVSSRTQNVKLAPGETSEIETDMPEVRNPILWSPEQPYLYMLSAEIIDSKTGEMIDRTTIPTGFRWFSFDGSEGFKLNGRHYKLRGVNRHQDLYPVGVALSDEAHRRDISLLKDLGCNFVRLAHYQQDDAILDECDRLGMIVWEEIPIVNMVPDANGFGDNCEKNLVELIRQHYNHPSIMLWGFMNEVLLRAPLGDAKEWKAAQKRILDLAHRLENKLKEEDVNRASVMAFHESDLYNSLGLDITDVQGWNLYQGWYGGDLNGFDRFLDTQHSQYPDRSLIISEWGAGSDRRLHSKSPVPFDFSIEYQQKYIEHYLPYIERNDFISGGAYWNFIDFNVAERQESMPRVNNKGLFYNDRKPKDVAYYLKSMWRRDIPVVHIAVRDRDRFVGEGTDTIKVKVYSNCPDIKLYADGQFLADKPTDNCFAIFDIPFREGDMALSAGGVLDGVAKIDYAIISCESVPDVASGESLAINVGSDCEFTSSVDGLTWLADHPYREGKWGYLNGKKRSVTSEIFNTHDTPLYQSMLEGVTGYCIDAPGGRYEVELLVTDTGRPGSSSPYLLGRDSDDKSDSNSIRMSINICGQDVESEFVPSQTSGYQHAVRKKYIVDNTEGKIDISLVPLSGKTALSGIVVRKI